MAISLNTVGVPISFRYNFLNSALLLVLYGLLAISIPQGIASPLFLLSALEPATANVFFTQQQTPLPPVISKAFLNPSIPFDSTTRLTFTLTNPPANTVQLTGVGFTDTLPNGLVIANPPWLTNTCGGTLTAIAGTKTISLSGGSLDVSSQCTITVNVTGTGVGAITNVSGNVTAMQSGPGSYARATINVVGAPSFFKAFNPSAIPVNGISTLTFTINSPSYNPVRLTGLAFEDPLRDGIVIAGSPNIINTCNGVLTAVAGSALIRLSGGWVDPGVTCTIQVAVTSRTMGVKNNITSEIIANETLPCNATRATLTVVGPPIISKAFWPNTIPGGGTSRLTFTLSNQNDITILNGVTFTDPFPTGLVVANPPNTTNTCMGTVNAVPGSNTISLSQGIILAKSSCAISVSVVDIGIGPAACTTVRNNITENIGCNEGGQGNRGEANLTVILISPPVFTKVFSPSQVLVNGSSVLTFTLTNPSVNQAALTGVSFTDNLPSGVVIANPNNLANTCNGSITAAPGTGLIRLTGGSIAANHSCTIAVTVNAITLGVKNNSTSIVNSNACEAGTSAQATLTVGEEYIPKVPMTDWMGYTVLLLLLAVSGTIFLIRMGSM